MNQQVSAWMPDQERKPFFRDTFSCERLQQRRRQIARALSSNEIAMFIGAPATGAFDLFRQYNDFYYLTGTEVPHSYLVIQGQTGVSTLFLEPLDAHMERSEGPILSLADGEYIRKRTGIERVAPRADLLDVCQNASKVYVPNENQEGAQACQDTIRHALHSRALDPFDTSRSRQHMVLRQLGLESHETGDLTDLLKRMRLLKDEEEIGWMVKAGGVTASAVNLAMQMTKAGIYEYQIGAVAEGVFLAAGATRGGYRPIIACGKNIWNAHYFRNDCRLSDGELVIMDYAPDLHYYTSDIGRMWPVNGTYSPRQRELYGFIVEYQKILLSVIEPGKTPEQVHEQAKRLGKSLVVDWPWSKPAYRQAAENVLEFNGHCSHTVGMAVHDNGKYFSEPMKPGLVFALDPQMWVPEEELYIRVEDTIIITEDGYINVTANAAFELDDVELLMTTAPELNSLGI